MLSCAWALKSRIPSKLFTVLITWQRQVGILASANRDTRISSPTSFLNGPVPVLISSDMIESVRAWPAGT